MLGTAVEHLRRVDGGMSAIVERVGPCGLAPSHPGQPFSALCESIIYQQLAGSAASAICRRFCALFEGSRFPRPDELLAAPDEVLRSGGLSMPKIRALRALARAVHEEGLDLAALVRLPDEAVKEALVRVKGIGPWTVDMHLIFHLGRTDVLPVGDLGIRKAARLVIGSEHLPAPPELERAARKWRPYRTVAAWYLWRSLGGVTIG